MRKSKVIIAVFAIALSATSYISFADNSSQRGVEQQDNSHSSQNSQAKTSEQAPQVRFGNPSRSIGSDADQNEYDAQDGGIAGVQVMGSRVFGVLPQNGATRTPATSLNLIKHTGSPMATTHMYAIYWGASFTAGYQSAVNSYLATVGLSSNALNTITDQYFLSGVKNQNSFSTTFFTDPSNPPTTAPTTASILAEAYKAVVTLGKSTLDPNGMYLVFTNNYPSKVNYCAWHGAGSVNNQKITVAYQPYLGGTSGCNPAGQAGFSASGSSVVGMDALANVASHEIYETITDPFLNAWYDSSGAEIGDKCAWYYGYTKIGTFSVQTEWSNKAGKCAAS